MTIGIRMTGAAGAEGASLWPGVPPKDECYWMTQVNKATILTNLARGLLTQDQAKAFGRGVAAVEKKTDVPGARRPKIYIRFEPLLIEAAGMEATLIHAGRSSQDIHATYLRTITRDQILDVARELNAARRALLSLSLQNRDVIAPGYTNGVAAQPNRLAHQWLGLLAGFTRDFERIREFFPRLNRSPMGTTVLNGTPWPLDRDGMASYLGFEGPIENAYDAAQIDSEDEALGASLVLVSPLLHVGHFIADIMAQYAQARPWILVGATYVSSAMPQKRNPGSLIDVRRDASAVLAQLQSVAWRSHNLMPGMYDSKDQGINTDILTDAASVLRAFAAVVPKLTVNAERALEEVNSEWTVSQNIADVLMKDFGIPFRAGHRFSSELVNAARACAMTPPKLDFELARNVWREVAAGLAEELPELPSELPISEAALRAALDPVAIVNARRSAGGPQEAEMERMFDSAAKAIEVDEHWITMKADALDAAQKKLDADFGALIA